jgi:hypothetical protein
MRLRAIATVWIALVVAISLVGFAGNTERPLEGTKIPVGGGSITIYASQSYYVRAGFVRGHFPGDIPEIKNDLGRRDVTIGDGLDFTLEIDGVPVKLRREIITIPLGHDGFPGEVKQQKGWYVQFLPGMFEAGKTYVLTATWVSRNPTSVWNVLGKTPRVTYTTLNVVP